jgi:hypothetical protein
MKTTEIYYPDGRVLVREWRDGTRPSYDWCRRAVGDGPIESVGRFMPDADYDGREQAWCHESGRLIGLPINVPGMKAVNWPEPRGGWDSLDPERPAGPPPGPVFLHAGMSPGEMAAAHVRMSAWQPVVGPVLVMRGWLEEEYDDDEHLTPDSLGEERP